ncbi:MAG: vitamin B12 dependent-methionine synthase activation domain-containing protein [Rhizomicrobium sp.]
MLNDASRAVGVASRPAQQDRTGTTTPPVCAATMKKSRRVHAARTGPVKRLSITDARANKIKTDWTSYTPPVPTYFGVRNYGPYDLGELARYIDWTPFFQTWELAGNSRRSSKMERSARRRAASTPTRRRC